MVTFQRGNTNMGVLNGINDRIHSKIDSVLPKIQRIVIDYAKRNHKFKTQSGNLIESIRAKVKGDSETTVIDFYFDEGKAPYASWIVRGTVTRNGKNIINSNGPDDFLTKAIEENINEIENILESVVLEAFNG